MTARTIDLNADLGENSPDRVVGDDDAMLDLVTSANISSGFHAGTPAGIRATMRGAAERGIAIGAHPAYRDYEGFGRRALEIEDDELRADVEYQLGASMGLAAAVGARVTYVKPHGALYNVIAIDPVRAQVVVDAIRAVDPDLVLLGLAGSLVLDVADRSGLATAAEAFADRAYTPEGLLVDRREQGAVLHDAELVGRRMARLAAEGVIEAIDGTPVPLRADSICVHGDSPDAIEIARATRDALAGAGIELRSFAPAPDAGRAAA